MRLVDTFNTLSSNTSLSEAVIGQVSIHHRASYDIFSEIILLHGPPTINPLKPITSTITEFTNKQLTVSIWHMLTIFVYAHVHTPTHSWQAPRRLLGVFTDAREDRDSVEKTKTEQPCTKVFSNSTNYNCSIWHAFLFGNTKKYSTLTILSFS